MNTELTNEEIACDSSMTIAERALILIEKNGALIKKEALKFSRRNAVCDIEDYEQEAASTIFCGVIKNYRPSEGRFSTYLTKCINRAMSALANRFSGPITVSPKTKRLIDRIGRMEREGVSERDICSKLRLSSRQIKNLRFIGSLSKVDPRIFEYVSEIPTSLLIEDANLSSLEKKALLMSSSGFSLREIGEVIGYSPEGVRVAKKRAIRKIRRVLNV